MTSIADFSFRIQAAIVDAILNDGTTADSLKANFQDKMEEVGRMLLSKDPALVTDAIAIFSDPNFNPQNFMDDLIKSMQNTGQPKAAKVSVDCKCPNLLNGHIKGCAYKP